MGQKLREDAAAVHQHRGVVGDERRHHLCHFVWPKKGQNPLNREGFPRDPRVRPPLPADAPPFDCCFVFFASPLPLPLSRSSSLPPRSTTAATSAITSFGSRLNVKIASLVRLSRLIVDSFSFSNTLRCSPL